MPFQSTLPRRERRKLLETTRIVVNFNPRSREGSDIPIFLHSCDSNHFNPRSREGSDSNTRFLFPPRLPISIHAPAKGATQKQLDGVFLRVFQSTLPRRERQQSAMGRYYFAPDFNPRSREGSDNGKEVYSEKYQISIHAPAKGATVPGSDKRSIALNFNPRSREGSDYQAIEERLKEMDFNPRSREGSDLVIAVLELTLTDFNPRSREGSDNAAGVLNTTARISIHAPAKGATEHRGVKVPVNAISIHAPAKGATTEADIIGGYDAISIHAPAKGATMRSGEMKFWYMISIHAPAKGATRVTELVNIRIDISIHAPAKGATSGQCKRHLKATFQSTLPRRERRRHRWNGISFRNFNPRSREGSDTLRQLIFINDNQFQSTLPRRERRKLAVTGRASTGISIHAPAKGATAAVAIFEVGATNFNPRSREGSDNLAQNKFALEVIISIHAPAKGATGRSIRQRYCERFQSTLPRRERHFPLWYARYTTKISIHAPAKGATMFIISFLKFRIQFQSTLPRRERPRALDEVMQVDAISIHAPAKGATVDNPCLHSIHTCISIHAPAKGATSNCFSTLMYSIISIHAPAKGATARRQRKQ